MFSLLERKEHAHEDSIWSCTWLSPAGSGDVIATGSLDNTVKIWDWSDAKQLHHRATLEGHHLGVISVDSRPQGSTVVSSSIDCTIRSFSVASTGDVEHRAAIDAGPVDSWTVALSPDEKRVATGAQHGRINLYSLEQSTSDAGDAVATRTTVESGGGKFMLTVAFSPDGRYLAAASIEGIIYVFDIESCTLLHTMEGHAMPIRSLVFSHDGRLILSGSDDKYMKLHDLSSPSPVVATLPGHSSWVLCVTLSQDSKHIASGSSDHTVRIWDFASRQQLHKFEDHTDQVWGVRFSPCGTRLVSASDDHSVAVYSIPS